MINPFTAWSRLVAAQAIMAGSSIRAAETLAASLSVIEKRTATMRAALADPLTADQAELGRMVPEKITAFSHAGEALASGMLAWNRAVLTEAQHLGMITSRGRAPTLGEWLELAARAAEFTVAASERTARVGADALTPVHAIATANARRLRRRQR